MTDEQKQTEIIKLLRDSNQLLQVAIHHLELEQKKNLNRVDNWADTFIPRHQITE